MKAKKAAAVILAAAAVLGAFAACGNSGKNDSSVVININNDKITKTVTGSGKMSKKAVSVPEGVCSFSTGSLSNTDSEIKVIIDPEASESSITADDNIFGDIELNIDEAEKKIILSGKEGVMFENINITLTLGAKVSQLNLSGNIQADYTLPEGADKIFVTESGICIVNVKGSCNTAVYDLSGSSKLYASEAIASGVLISAAGTCSAEVYANDIIDAAASGVSSITYGGNPVSVTESVSGQGVINKITNQ